MEDAPTANAVTHVADPVTTLRSTARAELGLREGESGEVRGGGQPRRGPLDRLVSMKGPLEVGEVSRQRLAAAIGHERQRTIDGRGRRDNRLGVGNRLAKARFAHAGKRGALSITMPAVFASRTEPHPLHSLALKGQPPNKTPRIDMISKLGERNATQPVSGLADGSCARRLGG